MIVYYFFYTFFLIASSLQAIEVTDFGKLYPTSVTKIEYPQTTHDVQAIVLNARKNNKTISIAGARHSEGGQSNAQDSINVDMLSMNKLIDLDAEHKRVKVQAGMTWEQLQNILHPLNLSVKVMQASNIFSIGGSACVNVHGRDPSYGPMIETIRSLTLVDHKGKVIHLSREKNPQLFSLVIGGYGLFGIITEIELDVTDNCICTKEQILMSYKNYTHYLHNKVLTNPNIQLHYARLVNIPGKNFLKEVLCINYIDQHKPIIQTILPVEKNIKATRFLMNMYRKYWGNLVNRIRWWTEEHLPGPWENVDVVTRNHIMRPYIKVLQSNSPKQTDLLQEFFIPVNEFEKFIEQLAALSTKYKIKLLNVTLRWTPKNNESFLSYSHEDTIAFVLYFTASLKTKQIKLIEKYTQELTDACLKCRGTFYLPYQRFATKQQLLQGYPTIQDFIKHKEHFDPSCLFVNNWYCDYILPTLTK